MTVTFDDAMLLASTAVAKGQVVFEGVTSTPWIVPNGVTAISAVAVGRGGVGTAGGGGGALSYTNGIAVTPGESLSIIIDGASSRIQRSATVLLSAQVGAGSNGGTALGGQAANGVGTVKFSGGQRSGSGDASGGAAGYTQNGGDGSGSQASGGGGGVGLNGGSAGGNGSNAQGAGSGGSGGGNGSGASGGDFGGGGKTSTGGRGAIRIIYGGGRSYPSNAGDV